MEGMGGERIESGESRVENWYLVGQMVACFSRFGRISCLRCGKTEASATGARLNHLWRSAGGLVTKDQGSRAKTRSLRR